MSLNKSAIRRLPLLAGASFLAVGFSVAFAPRTALAANECGNPSANGVTADILVCAPGAYPGGIDYSTTTNGNLTVILSDRVDTGTSNTAGVGGIRLHGNPGETMSLLRQDNAGVVGDPRIVNTTGRAVEVTTQGSGSAIVNLTDGDPTAGEATTPAASALAPMRLTGGTDAIRAEATGAGAVTVTIAETGTPSGTNNPRAIINAGALAGSNGSGVVARSTSGAINVDVRGAGFTINGTNGGGVVDAQSTTGAINVFTTAATGRLFGVDAVSTSGNVSVTGAGSGRLRGILAQTGGAGTVNVTVTGSVSANATDGQFGLGTTAGTGSTLITITAGTVSGGAGAAIRSISASTSAGAAVNVQNTGGVVTGWVDFSGVSAGGVTFNNAGASASGGIWRPSGTSTFSAFNDTVTLGGQGVNNSAAGTILNFGAGNDTFNVAGNYSVTTQETDIFGIPTLLTGGTTLNFGTGVDTMNVSGVLTVDYMTVTGLENFNNSGLVLLGAQREGSFQNPNYMTTDLAGDDVLSLPGVAYTGSGSARIGVDVLLGGGSQASCASPTGVGDCLNLQGGSTAGSTLITATYTGDEPALGGYDPVGITVVDVAGGTSAAGHFTLDPNSPGYVDDPMFGGAIDRPGLFRYTLRYDPTTQRHAIVGVPRATVMEYAVLSGAAQSIWHMSADTVTDRQTDLREGSEGGSIWMRASGEYTQREVATDLQVLGDVFAFDNAYKLYAGQVIGGMDFVVGSSGGYDYVVGGQIGYIGSSFDLAASDSTGRFSGATGGVYASLWSPRLFLDGTVNANVLTLNYDAPALGSKTNTYLNSVGGKVEGGARLPLGSASFVEPIATLAFVRTSFEEISLTGGEVKPGDAESLRGALGLRFGAELSGQAVTASYFLTGRAWNEFDGENEGIVANPGTDLTFADDLSGTFGEAEAGVSLYNAAGTLSGFLTSGVKFKDGYNATNLSLGLRMAW